MEANNQGLCSDVGVGSEEPRVLRALSWYDIHAAVSRGRPGMMAHGDIPSRKKCDLLKPLHKLFLAWRLQPIGSPRSPLEDFSESLSP